MKVQPESEVLKTLDPRLPDPGAEKHTRILFLHTGIQELSELLVFGHISVEEPSQTEKSRGGGGFLASTQLDCFCFSLMCVISCQALHGQVRAGANQYGEQTT